MSSLLCCNIGPHKYSNIAIVFLFTGLDMNESVSKFLNQHIYIYIGIWQYATP